MKERHLQALLKSEIEVISPDTLVVAEEFCDWEGSQRRIDLLGIDRDANLVVIELKRTKEVGHAELQAIRYAAMISTMTFDKLVEVYGGYLRDNPDDNLDQDAEKSFWNSWSGRNPTRRSSVKRLKSCSLQKISHQRNSQLRSCG